MKSVMGPREKDIFDIMERYKLQRILIRPNDPVIDEAEWLAESLKKGGFEKMLVSHYPGLIKSMDAIHSTVLGPAAGGIRMIPYRNAHEMATNVMKAAQYMTLKSAMLDIEAGGAKCAVWGDPEHEKSEALVHQLAEEFIFLNTEEETHIPSVDINWYVSNLLTMRDYYVAQNKKIWVTGFDDPSWATAHGIYFCIEFIAKKLGISSWKDMNGAIQGIGQVGMDVARLLHRRGVPLVACDARTERVSKFYDEFYWKVLSNKRITRIVPPEEIFDQECTFFIPCAGLPGTELTPDRIRRLRCKAVVGSANGILATPGCELLLAKRGIIYVTDFVANAGGLWSAFREHVARRGHKEFNQWRDAVSKLCNIIPQNTHEILWLAHELGITATEAAYKIANQRIERKKTLSQTL